MMKNMLKYERKTIQKHKNVSNGVGGNGKHVHWCGKVFKSIQNMQKHKQIVNKNAG